MDLVVSPVDAATLRVLDPHRGAGGVLLVRCPSCERRFQLAAGGLRELPQGTDRKSS